MSKRIVMRFLLVCLVSAIVATSARSADNNRGVLNGPLNDSNQGHRAKGEGDHKTLRMAIEYLMKKYRSRYSKGTEFLKRLNDPKCKDVNSEEFKALKKEAIFTHNPAINFDKILMVRSGTGIGRYTSNWTTRTNAAGRDRRYDSRDLNSVLSKLRGKDNTIKSLYSKYSKAERDYNGKKKRMSRSKAYRKERDRKKRDAMIKNMPSYKTYYDLKKQIEAAAAKHSEYNEMKRMIKERKAAPNYEDELVLMSRDGTITTVYTPSSGVYIGEVDLHFDLDKVLFTSFPDKDSRKAATSKNKGFAVCEIKIDPNSGRMRGKSRIVSPDMGADVDNYDACYLPDGKILFASTAAYEGVPCVGGGSYVANLYRMNSDGKEVRRLTFEQDGNWHPTVMENGRILYLRWEYTDSAHYFSRVLMSMNPDGTDQKAFYGSNSYWPNSMFFARQIPGKTNMFVSTITGHHSNAKGGALCLFDVTKGRHEADGAVQFLTGRGKKVKPLVIDGLHRAYSPMFYTPFPIDDTFFFATHGGGGVLLLDVFDNVVTIKANDDKGRYHEPIPFRKTKKPFQKPDAVDPSSQTASVIINDVYAGPGLAGVPRGTVKGIRVYRYEYGPRHKGGHYAMGMETCWDAKQILGVAKVEEDGSASFIVPANTPFAMQPIDAEGKALQLMRSWAVAMPGEGLGCIGCHESQNMTPLRRQAKAMGRAPEKLTPFFGPARGFSFEREVQPVVDKYCVGCHDGSKDLQKLKSMGIKVADRIIGTGVNTGKKFVECGIPDLTNARSAHTNLHPYVRRNGPEGDYHLLTPLEFHADTSELVQMFQKGHHNVRLDDDSWRKIYTWIDLNAPLHGTWTEAGAKKDILDRRMELRKLYANVDFNPEKILNPYTKKVSFEKPAAPKRMPVVRPEKASVRGYRAGSTEIDLGDGIKMKLARIPAGEFSMGSNSETPMEQPVSRVRIDKSFMMGTTEVTLEMYRQFDPDYLNGVYDMHYKDQVHRGYYMNDMQYPVIRVNWHKAMEFCNWLSKKSGKKVTLPTEAQWEWACRAGTDTPLSYGGLDSDFSKYANLADVKVKEMAVRGVNPKPMPNPKPDVDFELKDPRYNDNTLHLAEAGKFKPNAWGLYDMHGNAAEWTRSAYVPYPYKDDRRNSDRPGTKRVVRGGSWHDRPFRSSSSFRLGFNDWHRVYHVGFRVIIED